MSSAVGVDLGCFNCYIAVTRTGGLETIDNDYSERGTPLAVSFTASRRFTGTSAKNQNITNFGNTVTYFKHLIGLDLDSDAAKYEMSFMSGLKFVDYSFTDEDNQVFSALTRDSFKHVGVELNLGGNQFVLHPIQLYSAMYSELKSTMDRHFRSPQANIVVSAPCYFTDYQRRGLIAAGDAVSPVGVRVLGVVNDLTAVSVAYCLYNSKVLSDAASLTVNGRYVVFVDVGYSQAQVCVTCFKGPGKIEVLSCLGSRELGGREIDRLICDIFAERFKTATKGKIDPHTRLRQYFKLMEESSSFKKKVNSTNLELPFSIDCFIDDIDLNSKLGLPELLTHLEQTYLNKLKNLVLDCLSLAHHNTTVVNSKATAPFDVKSVHSVELVGGSTRLNPVKNMLKSVFSELLQQKDFNLNTTLNADEAVARGCALMCAKLSPTVQIKPFEVMDTLNFDVFCRVVNINDDGTIENSQQPIMLNLFKKGQFFPCTSQITVKADKKFVITIFQKDNNNNYEYKGESFLVKGACADDEGQPQVTKIKIRQNENGCINVISAAMFVKETEKNEETKEEPKESVKQVRLGIETLAHDMLSDNFLKTMKEAEGSMLDQIKFEKERGFAKNDLEETIYSFRSKLSEEYFDFTDKGDELNEMLNGLEDWLYDEGENETKEVYELKKKELLEGSIQPIVARVEYAKMLPAIIERFKTVMLHYKKQAEGIMCVNVEKEAKNEVKTVYSFYTEEDVKQAEVLFGKVDECAIYMSGVEKTYKAFDKKNSVITCSIKEISNKLAYLEEEGRRFDKSAVEKAMLQFQKYTAEKDKNNEQKEEQKDEPTQ